MKKFYSKIVSEKQPVKSYPKLMINKNHNTIYLMQRDKIGTLIVVGNSGHTEIGEQYSCLNMYCLSEYSGTVELGEE